MTLPVILPSGKTVDQSTLDKYDNAEESWGRSPNDPFTGVLFHKDFKPLPNVPLKAQLDSFLLKHSNSNIFHNFPRTVGRNLLKRKCLEVTPDTRPVCPIFENSNFIPEQASIDIIEPNEETGTSILTHEQQLSLSLSSAMNTIIKSSKFRRRNEEIQTACCSLCKLKNPQVMYLSACCHHICYNCLVVKKIMQCDCGKKLTSQDMKRVHI